MCNNAIHVLGITEIRNNGGDDSLWLYTRSEKKTDPVSDAFNFLELENRGDNNKVPLGFESGLILKHEAATH